MHTLPDLRCKRDQEKIYFPEYPFLLSHIKVKNMPSVEISNQRKAACVQIYMQTGSITMTRRWYRTTYGTAAHSSNSIPRWHRRFLDNGTVADLPRSGRPQISPQILTRIEEAFHCNPRLSLRVAERELQVLRSTICDVLKKKLIMFPYKISFLQEMLTRDYAERSEWAQHCRTEWKLIPIACQVLFSRTNFFFRPMVLLTSTMPASVAL